MSEREDWREKAERLEKTTKVQVARVIPEHHALVEDYLGAGRYLEIRALAARSNRGVMQLVPLLMAAHADGLIEIFIQRRRAP